MIRRLKSINQINCSIAGSLNLTIGYDHLSVKTIDADWASPKAYIAGQSYSIEGIGLARLADRIDAAGLYLYSIGSDDLIKLEISR